MRYDWVCDTAVVQKNAEKGKGGALGDRALPSDEPFMTVAG